MSIKLEGAATGGVSEPATRPYDPSKDREEMRGRIAFVLILLLAAVVIMPVVMVLVDRTLTPEAEKIVGVLLTPITGLVGAVVGFYFGEKAR